MSDFCEYIKPIIDELYVIKNLVDNESMHYLQMHNENKLIIEKLKQIINKVIDHENMGSKQSLGQFYTTNQEYILQGINIPHTIKNIIEPFAGNGDLITFIEKEQNKNNVKYIIEYIYSSSLTVYSDKRILSEKIYVINEFTVRTPSEIRNETLEVLSA